MKKRIPLLITSILMIVLCLSFVSCGSDDGSTTFISLDINPSIEIVVNGENEIESIYAANDDAQVLLCDEDFIGEDVDDAIEEITELAIELGYITEENRNIGMTITSTLEGKADALYTELNELIVEVADDEDIALSTTTECPYSIVRRLKKLKEENPQNQELQSLSEKTFKLALSAIENNDELTLEDAIKLTDTALVEQIQKSHANSTNLATKAYEKAKESAFKAYDKGVVLLKEGVYSAYYLKNVVSHIDTFWYGGVYHMYKIAESGFAGIATSLEYVADLSDYPLDEQTVQMVAQKFNITDTSVLKNADGEITMKSVEAYLDRLIRNANIDTEALEALYDEALEAIESVSKLQSLEAAKELITEAEAVTAAAENVLGVVYEAFTDFASILPATAKAPFIEVKSTFDDIKAELAVSKETGTLTVAQIRACEQRLSDAADGLIEKMTQDLGQEEMDKIELDKQEFENDLNELKQTLEDAIATAEEEALNKLTELKEKRKQ